MADPLFTVVYDGSTDPDTINIVKYGLTTGNKYKFRVYSVNFNGLSPASSIIEAYVCGLPSEMTAPTLKQSTQTDITVVWEPPKNNGGCSIYDYGVYRDADGTGTTFTEVNPAGTFIRNDPFNR